MAFLVAPALILILLLVGAFWVWMIVDCATKEPDNGNTKLVWILIIILTGTVGAAIYYLARRPQRKAELGR
ncbi:MAG: PLD nuclease N-terminal domain-containing protein [Chloroflexi bacterium]|nr:PLD nuclease N-terminal domain-containing protein [Chloroflexota bacterium]MDA1218541.1 PLD nuclease N-terminal domain-containing protein [Chloroflexota bacterium]